MPTSARPPKKSEPWSDVGITPYKRFFITFWEFTGEQCSPLQIGSCSLLQAALFLRYLRASKRRPYKLFHITFCVIHGRTMFAPTDCSCSLLQAALFLRYLWAAKRRPYTLFHDTYISIRPQQRTPKLSTLNSQRFIALIR